jgi:hypothetical protein
MQNLTTYWIVWHAANFETLNLHLELTSMDLLKLETNSKEIYQKISNIEQTIFEMTIALV